MTYYTGTAKETEDIGALLAKGLDDAGCRSAFIAMRGEMGVGKTAFTRGFAAYFGINSVKSPTYTIVNEYRGKKRIYHFDMYRISSSDDLISTGFDDYVASEGYVIAEWSENIEEDIPEGAIFVTVSRTDEENGRRIDIENADAFI